MNSLPAAGSHAGAGGEAPRVFVGVGVDAYRHFGPLARAIEEARGIARLLESTRGFRCVVIENPDEAGAEQLADALPDAVLAGGSLVVLWAGHGELSPEGPLRLITSSARALATPTRTAQWLASLAVRSGAAQVLVILDTCYSGTGAYDAMHVVGKLRAELPEPRPAWVGVLAAAQPYERARDGTLYEELTRVLSTGPRDATLLVRFNAYNEGVLGSDVMEVLLAEWPPASAHRPEQFSTGLPAVMFPNPRHDASARESVVEQLVLAARGVASGEEGDFFSGRRLQLARLASWLHGPGPSLLVLTGPPGSGKSALLGRLVSMSDAGLRPTIAIEDAACDPGAGSIQANVHARGATVDELAAAIDEQLCACGALPPAGYRRNGYELLGAMERHRPQVALAVDGLDEAGDEAWPIARQLLAPLGGLAKVLVATREVERAAGASLVQELSSLPPLDLGDPALDDQTELDVAEYVRCRLEGVGPPGGTTDAGRVTELLLAAGRQPGVHAAAAGLFLLARLVTSQLRSHPIDTGAPGWEQRIARGIDEGFERDLSVIAETAEPPLGLAPLRRALAALAWAYGAGMPIEVWSAVDAALVGDGAGPGAAGEPGGGRDREGGSDPPGGGSDPPGGGSDPPGGGSDPPGGGSDPPGGGSDPEESDTGFLYRVLVAAGRHVVAGPGGGRALYRLVHQRLVEHLRPARTGVLPSQPPPASVAVAAALCRLYRALLDGGEAPESNRYLHAHAWRHCVDAGAAGLEALHALADEHPALSADLALAFEQLASRFDDAGLPGEGVALAEQAVALRRAELEAAGARAPALLAGALGTLGALYGRAGREVEALVTTSEAVERFRELASDEPVLARDLADALVKLAIASRALDLRAEALEASGEAVATYRRLVEGNPAYRSGLAGALANHGVQLSDAGHFEEAVSATEEAVALRRELAAGDDTAAARRLAVTLDNLAVRYAQVGRRADALASAEEAVSMQRAIAAGDSGGRSSLASALFNLGGRYGDLGRFEEAAGASREAVAVYRAVVPEIHSLLTNLGGALSNLGGFLLRLSLLAEARRALEESIAIYTELAAGNAAVDADLAAALSNLATLEHAEGRPLEALDASSKVVSLYRSLVAGQPGLEPNLATALFNLGNRYAALGAYARAHDATEEAAGAFRLLAERHRGFAANLAMCLTNMAIYRARGDLGGDALGLAGGAVELWRTIVEGDPSALASLAAALASLRDRQREVGDLASAVETAHETVETYRTLLAGDARFEDDAASAALASIEILQEYARSRSQEPDSTDST